jgi:hypothetical protein
MQFAVLEVDRLDEVGCVVRMVIDELQVVEWRSCTSSLGSEGTAVLKQEMEAMHNLELGMGIVEDLCSRGIGQGVFAGVVIACMGCAALVLV